MSNFSFFDNVFKSRLLQMLQKASVCGKGLVLEKHTFTNIVWFDYRCRLLQIIAVVIFKDKLFLWCVS